MDDGSKSAAEQKKPNEEPDRQQPDKTRAGKRSVLSGILGRLKGAPDVTEEDIRSIVSEGQEQGVLEASEADMISNIFEFSDKQAQDIMTNRVSIVAVDGSMTLEEALHFMLEGNNSRFPVDLENIDHIIGILNIRDAVKRLYEGDANDLPIRKIKGLLWEGDGFLLLYKRLEQGVYQWQRSEKTDTCHQCSCNCENLFHVFCFFFS